MFHFSSLSFQEHAVTFLGAGSCGGGQNVHTAALQAAEARQTGLLASLRLCASLGPRKKQQLPPELPSPPPAEHQSPFAAP